MNVEAPLASGPMESDAGTTGTEIKARRVRLGLSISELATEAKVDRSRISAIEAADPTVRESTIGAVRSALDRLELELGMDDAIRTVGDPAEDLVEFVIEGNFGVRAVVKGPVRNLEALQEAAAKLIRSLKDIEAVSHDANGSDSAAT